MMMINYDVIIQGSVNHYVHHAKFNWNYGSRFGVQQCGSEMEQSWRIEIIYLAAQ